MKDRFSRLLAACERLARDEAAALSRRNFDVLARTRQVKSALLADLAAESGELSRSSRIRLARLLDSSKQNSQALSNMMAVTGEKLRKLRTSSNRLNSLRNVYTTGREPRLQAFSAHG